MTDFCEFSYTDSDLITLPARPERSNKYTFGKVLCVCGSYGMAGASYLSALGAYRSGAGLVEIFAPEENRIILQTLIPEAILKIYDQSSPDTDMLLDAMASCDAIVVGCGLGRSSTALAILRTVLKNSKVPTIIDADALNLIAEHPILTKYIDGKIITPHIKEMSRLCKLDVDNILEAPQETAYNYAKAHGAICVLKDHNTVVSDGGERLYVNKSGNSSMATGGSGDVLAGIIGALCAQSHLSLSKFNAAALGVYIHGRAGDAAAKKLGEYGVMASDIANNINFYNL